MIRVNENTASELEGAEPRCLQRGVPSIFLQAMTLLVLVCFLYMQTMIGHSCLGSTEEAESLQNRVLSGTEGMDHSAFLSSLQIPSTIVVNETEGNFACLPSAAESLQNLRDTKGGGSISALGAPLQPLCATREGEGATSSPESRHWNTSSSTWPGSVLQTAIAAGLTPAPGIERAPSHLGAIIPVLSQKRGFIELGYEQHPTQTISSQTLTGALGLRVFQDDDDAVASMSSYATKVCDPITTQEHLTLRLHLNGHHGGVS